MGSLSPSELNRVTERLYPITWVLRTTTRNKDGEEVNDCWVAFCVDKRGLIMSTMSGYKPTKSGIQARRLFSDRFTSANIVFKQPKWDLMLLQVEIDDVCEAGVFADSGAVSEGDTLISTGHPLQLLGSLLIGRVAYQCQSDVVIPPLEDKKHCATYYPSLSDTTIPYRRLGDVWNAESLFESESDSVDPLRNKFKKLSPLIPVIQCNGLCFALGCSGAPVINIEGDIVGILHSRYECVDVALHVSLMKEFLKRALQK